MGTLCRRHVRNHETQKRRHMKWFSLKGLGRRSRYDDLDDEIQAHIRLAIADRIARGETEAEARAAAIREFGNIALVKETTRSVWTWTAVEQFLQDLRFGFRIL